MTLKDKIVVCKKPHECNWCGEIIGINEKANNWACIFEGDFNHGYMHLECRDALRRSDNEEYCIGEQQRGKSIQKRKINV